jgi:hypothetical protein
MWSAAQRPMSAAEQFKARHDKRMRSRSRDGAAVLSGSHARRSGAVDFSSAIVQKGLASYVTAIYNNAGWDGWSD